jgi:tetratricopeptide (TPR) repeat protein
MTYEEYLEIGDDAYEQNQYLRAVQAYRNALEKKKEVYPLLKLARCYLENEFPDEAEQAYGEANKLDSGDSYLRSEYAYFLCEYKGNYKEADDIIRGLIDEFPEQFELHEQYAELYSKYFEPWGGSQGRIMTYFDKAMDHHECTEFFYTTLFTIYHKCNMKNEASVLLRKIIDRNKLNDRLFSHYDKLFLEDPVEKEGLLKTLISKYPFHPRYYNELIRVKAERGDSIDEIRPLFQRLFELEPRNDRNCYDLGEYYLEINDLEHAEECYRKAADMLYCNALFKFAYTISNTPNDKYQKAIKLYEEALTRNPHDDGIYINMGACSVFLKDDDRAMSFYVKASEMNPLNDLPHENIGNIYQRSGDYDASIERYRRAIDLNRNNHKAYNNMGISYYSLGYYDEALSAYKRAFELHYRDTLSFYNAALAAMELEQYQDSVDFIQRAIELIHEDPPCHVRQNEFMLHYTLGRALYFQKKHEEACQAFLQAFSLRPDYKDTMTFLGIVLNELGRLDEGRDYLNRALGIDPIDYIVHEYIGWNAFLKGELEEALRYTKRSVEINPENGDGYFNLGRIYSEMNKHEISRECFEKARSLGNKEAGKYLHK